MTLDEAIQHCEEVAETEEQRLKEWYGDYPHLKKIDSCLKCAEEHRQLAEWLKELKELKEQIKWILVNERLPEDKQQILISISWDNDIHEVRQGDIDSINYFKQFKRITSIAWMSLPDPYVLDTNRGKMTKSEVAECR